MTWRGDATRQALLVVSLVGVTLSLVGCSTEPAVRAPDTQSEGSPDDRAAAVRADEPQSRDAARNEAPKTATPRFQPSATVSLDVTDEPLEDVLRSVSRSTGINIVVDPGVKETVSITFHKLPLRTAVDVLARQTNCVVVAEGNHVFRFSQPPPVTLEFHDADLRTVLTLLAKQSGANIVLSEEVQGRVTVGLRDVPWDAALEVIAKTAGYVVVYEGKEKLAGPVRLVR